MNPYFASPIPPLYPLPIITETMNKETEKKLAAKNTRPTGMRILTYDLLEAQSSALSLSEIEALLYPADRTTLYRTLKTFEEKGLVHCIQDDNIPKYRLCGDGCTEETHKDLHLHFYCKICRETTCHENVPAPVTTPAQFRIDEVRFFAKGICENCLSETF